MGNTDVLAKAVTVSQIFTVFNLYCTPKIIIIMMLYNNLYCVIPSMETYSSHLETHSDGKIVVSGFLPALA